MKRETEYPFPVFLFHLLDCADGAIFLCGFRGVDLIFGRFFIACLCHTVVTDREYGGAQGSAKSAPDAVFIYKIFHKILYQYALKV